MLWQPTRNILQPNQNWRRPQTPAAAGGWSLVSGISTGLAGSSSGGTTGAIDTTGASLLLVNLCYYHFVSGLSLSDSKSNSWTPLTSVFNGSTLRNNIYYCIPTSVGSGHTVSVSGTQVYGTAIFAAFAGGTAVSPFDQQSGYFNAGASTSIPTTSITPTANNELVIAGIAINDQNNTNLANVTAVDGGFTIIDDSVPFTAGSYNGSCAAYLIQTSAAAANPTWTLNFTSYCSAQMASFKVA